METKRPITKDTFVYKWRYIRDEKRRPVTTICEIYLINEKFNEAYIGYGLADCSPKDNVIKDEGRKIAYGRAMKGVKQVYKEQKQQISIGKIRVRKKYIWIDQIEKIFEELPYTHFIISKE